MKFHSRREFIKDIFSFSLKGYIAAFFLSVAGCGNKNIFNLFGDSNTDDSESETSQGNFEPGYLKLHKSGKLKLIGDELWNIMGSCVLCPRRCKINRLKGKKGFCQASSKLEISSYCPHFGEEPPLVGKGGSGTVFFSNCALRCVFCINWEISQGGEGRIHSIEDLADMMLKLQKKGCHNINVVTPTHYSPHIVKALDIAAEKGLKIPLVYNTCGWERTEILKKLDGIVDIYLPDFKYSDGSMAAKYSSFSFSYPEVTKPALVEMQRQVGTASLQKDGIMKRGLMIRHLVMPNNVGGTKEVMEWIAGNLPKDTYVNIMSQYRPCYKANDYPEIARRLKLKEYKDAIRFAREAGLTNYKIQINLWLI